MTLAPGTHWLGIFYCASEVVLSLSRRAKASATSVDAGSIRMLWIVIMASITASFIVRDMAPWAQSTTLARLRDVWFILFVGAIALRWWSIVHLGRFFTVNVAIAADQHVVDDGPYRLVRHPSYTGALLAFLTYGLSVANWLACAVIIVPITAAFLRRMRIEEQALAAGLGEPYRAYMARTKRLVPFLY
jgi:protein-S-isoprenylcysteine O-methyltransferase